MDINKYSYKNKVRGTNLFCISDTDEADIYELLYAAKLFKKRILAGEDIGFLKNPAALITDAPYDTGFLYLKAAAGRCGGGLIELSLKAAQENVCQNALALAGCMMGSVFVSGGGQRFMSELASASGLSVINAGGADSAPVPALADLLTVWELKKRLSGLKVAYIGKICGAHANSFIIAAIKCGCSVTVSAAEGGFSAKWTQKAMQYGEFAQISDPFAAAAGADVIYGDTDEIDAGALLSHAAANAIYLNPNPKELKALEPRADVILQASNRLPVYIAVMSLFAK